MVVPFHLALVVCIALLYIDGIQGVRTAATVSLRGGLVPQANEDGEYYEKFKIDYGCEDNVRVAGSMRGLIKGGKLASLPQGDRFLRWINRKLEKGPQPPNGRVKPFYAADFGTRNDLKRGENPKIVIVNRKLEWDKNSVLKMGPAKDEEPDVEVREVWQPWLRRQCDFVVRYIVPNRANIIELMEGQGRFRSELVVGGEQGGQRTATVRLTFKPTLLQRLQGKKDVVVTKPLDAKQLFAQS